MISKDKTYRTRDGREVRIYATDGGDIVGKPVVHGAYVLDGSWVFCMWFAETGKILTQWCETDSKDLIEVKPRHKRTVWINVYDHGPVIVYKEEKTAAVNRMHGCIACIKVDLDFEEGEGL